MALFARMFTIVSNIYHIFVHIECTACVMSEIKWFITCQCLTYGRTCLAALEAQLASYQAEQCPWTKPRSLLHQSHQLTNNNLFPLNRPNLLIFCYSILYLSHWSTCIHVYKKTKHQPDLQNNYTIFTIVW